MRSPQPIAGMVCLRLGVLRAEILCSWFELPLYLGVVTDVIPPRRVELVLAFDDFPVRHGHIVRVKRLVSAQPAKRDIKWASSAIRVKTNSISGWTVLALLHLVGQPYARESTKWFLEWLFWKLGHVLGIQTTLALSWFAKCVFLTRTECMLSLQRSTCPLLRHRRSTSELPALRKKQQNTQIVPLVAPCAVRNVAHARRIILWRASVGPLHCDVMLCKQQFSQSSTGLICHINYPRFDNPMRKLVTDIARSPAHCPHLHIARHNSGQSEVRWNVKHRTAVNKFSCVFSPCEPGDYNLFGKAGTNFCCFTYFQRRILSVVFV